MQTPAAREAGIQGLQRRIGTLALPSKWSSQPEAGFSVQVHLWPTRRLLNMNHLPRCRPICLRDAHFGQGVHAAAEAAQKLKAHCSSAERLLAELRAGAVLRSTSGAAFHRQQQRLRGMAQANVLQLHGETRTCGTGAGSLPQAVSPIDQWLLAPSPS